MNPHVEDVMRVAQVVQQRLEVSTSDVERKIALRYLEAMRMPPEHLWNLES